MWNVKITNTPGVINLGPNISRQQLFEILFSSLLDAGNFTKIRKELYEKLEKSIYVSPGAINHTLKEFRDFAKKQEEHYSIKSNNESADQRKERNAKRKLFQEIHQSLAEANLSNWATRIFRAIKRSTPKRDILDEGKGPRGYYMIVATSGSFSDYKKKWRKTIKNDSNMNSITKNITLAFLDKGEGGHIFGVAQDMTRESIFSDEDFGSSGFNDAKLQKEMQRLINSFLQSLENQPEVIESLDILITTEFDVKFVHSITNNARFKVPGSSGAAVYKSWLSKIPYAIEIDVVNRGRTGSLAGLRRWFKNEFIKNVLKNERKYTKQVLDALEKVEVGSNSSEEALRELETLWTGLSAKHKKFTTAARRRLQEAKKVNIKQANIPLDLRIGNLKTTNTGSVSFTSVKNYINANLHRILREDVMAKGGATERLNYRTGRFAESARVVKMRALTGKTVEITVDYMKYPYNVFSPMGRLYKPLRDPRVLIHQAVRVAFKELYINKLRIKSRVV